MPHSGVLFLQFRSRVLNRDRLIITVELSDQRPVRFIEAPHGTDGRIDRRHSRAVLVVYWQNPICRKRRLLDERIEVGRENAIDLAGSHKTAKHLMSKTGSALGDRIVYILSAMPGLRINRF